LCADDGLVGEGRGKPCPDIFLAAAREMLGVQVGNAEEGTEEQGVLRSKGLVFEDAVPGVLAAKRAGMSVVWVPDERLVAVGTRPSDLNPTDTLASLEDFVPEKWGLPPYPK